MSIMHSQLPFLEPHISKSIEPNPDLGIGLRLTGWTFNSSEQVTKYFSYYGEHILAGTLMVGGGYNANEWADRSVIQVFKSEFLREWRRKHKGIISTDQGLIDIMEMAFREQYPLWSGVLGHPDLMKNQTMHEIGGKYKHLEGTVRLAVDFLLKNGERETQFTQQYILGIIKWNVDVAGTCMVGSRDGLYNAFSETYGEKYPVNNPYPIVQLYQTDPVLIEGCERIRGLR